MTDQPKTAAQMLAMAAFVPHPDDDPPGYEVQLPWINMTIGVAAGSVDEAREKVAPLVAQQLERSTPA